MAPFYGLGSTASRLKPLRGGSLLFTTKFPEIPGTHFIDLGRMKGWVDLGPTQWFWTRDSWIGNPASWPLGHCLWWAMRKLWVEGWLIRVVQAMYESPISKALDLMSKLEYIKALSSSHFYLSLPWKHYHTISRLVALGISFMRMT